MIREYKREFFEKWEREKMSKYFNVLFFSECGFKTKGGFDMFKTESPEVYGRIEYNLKEAVLRLQDQIIRIIRPHFKVVDRCEEKRKVEEQNKKVRKAEMIALIKDDDVTVVTVSPKKRSIEECEMRSGEAENLYKENQRLKEENQKLKEENEMLKSKVKELEVKNMTIVEQYKSVIKMFL